MANNDCANKCIAANPTKYGGIIAGQTIFGRAVKRQETYDFKTGDMIPNMTGSGTYQTGSPDLSGVAKRLDGRYDTDRNYYST